LDQAENKDDLNFDQQYERMVKKQLGAYIKEFAKLSLISPFKKDPFTPENRFDVYIKKSK